MNKQQSFKDLWDCNKKSNIYVIRVTERREKGSKAETIFEEIMTKEFPSFASDRPRFKN